MPKRPVYIETSRGDRLDFTLDIGNRRSVTLSVAEGKLIVRVPRKFDHEEVRLFIEKNLDWIYANLKKSGSRSCTPRDFVDGETIMLLGQELTIRTVKSDSYYPPRIERDEFQVAVCGDATREYMQRQIMGTIYAMAEAEIKRSINTYAKAMGLYPKKVTIKDMSASWGRCSSKGTISINYKVIAYPRTHIDYVCIHELSHLKHMDHSPEFWALVATQCPDWKRIRASMRS